MAKVKQPKKAVTKKKPSAEAIRHHKLIATNLRNARLAAGFETISAAARYIGMSISAAIQHESMSETWRNPKLEQLRKYAKAYNTTLDALEGGILSTREQAPTVRVRDIPERKNLVSAPILGTAQAGQWREVDPIANEAAQLIPARPHADFVFAVNIAGDSMNRIIQDGDIVIVKPWQKLRRDPRNNEVLLVQREHNGRYELTVKTFRNGELWPESTNPRWRNPVPMRDGDVVTIVGLVVGFYRTL